MKPIKNVLMAFSLIVFLEFAFEIIVQKKYLHFNSNQYLGFLILFIFNYFFVFSIFLILKLVTDHLSKRVLNLYIFIGICNLFLKGFVFFSKSYNLTLIQNYLIFLPSLIILIIGLIEIKKGKKELM